MKFLNFSTLAILTSFLVLSGCQPEMSPVEPPGTAKTLRKVSLPGGSTVTHAYLSVYQTDSNPGHEVTAYRITAPWEETQVTWDNFAGAYDNTYSWGSFTTDGAGERVIDITSLVEKWVDGTYDDNGVLLYQEGAGTTYYSSNYTDKDLRPKLELTYDDGSGNKSVTIRRGVLGDVKDAYIWEYPGYTTQNFGGSVNLHTGLVVNKMKYSLLQFDLTVICTASIGNQVWEEKNGTLTFEQGVDAPIVGVMVTLNKGLADEQVTYTDANGQYYFNNLCPGTYTVTYTTPTGFSPLTPCDDAVLVDNNNNCNGVSTVLTAGETNHTIDFGFKKGTDYCPPDYFGDCPSPVGRSFTNVLPNGDVEVTYQQFGINDNTYGSGSDWGHQFKSMLGSDKAQFIFTDGNGNVVLDFLCDYLTAASGTAAGYACLGATGGDGKLTTGDAAWILSATTSLAENLKTYAGTAGYPTVGGINLWQNSPASNASPFGAWDFINSYTVVISKAAFGTAGFGSVAIGEVHNSPHRCGPSNAIVPVPCDGGPPTPCNLTYGLKEIKDRQVKITIKNNGSSSVVMSRIELTWPTKNGKLQKTKLGRDDLYTVKTAPPYVNITDFRPSDPKKYTVEKGKTEELKFEFEKNAAQGGYIIHVEFGEGCSLDLVIQ
jgi:hypothetical protein